MISDRRAMIPVPPARKMQDKKPENIPRMERFSSWEKKEHVAGDTIKKSPFESHESLYSYRL
jgi:hypothetical protein